MNRIATLLCAAALFHCEMGLRGADNPGDASTVAQEKALTKDRMQQIYNAIQVYRKDHKDLPDFLSDLYPPSTLLTQMSSSVRLCHLTLDFRFQS